MAKRISGLTTAVHHDNTYVIEIDDPTGSTAETEKVNFTEINRLLLTLNDSWTSLTLVNSWTGSVKMRVDKDNYLEIFYNLNSSAATSATVVSSIPSGFVLDYNFRISHYSSESGVLLPIYILFNSSVFNIGNYELQTSINTFTGYFRTPLLAP